MTLMNESASKKISCDEIDASESPIDTQYFGVTSAKVILKKACLTDQAQNDFLNFSQEFEFVSITNKSNNPFNNRWLGEKTRSFLTDMNIQLIKKVSITKKHDDGKVEISDNFPENDRIIQIAETAFVFSRFLNDPYLPVEKARRIYGDMTKNAFRKPGRFFTVIKQAEIIIGYLLFSINEQMLSSTLEFVAIAQEYKGRGIGGLLIRSMEDYVAKKGIHTIKVGTQLSNIDALKFYTSYGFKHFECNSIYHYWPSKP
jgi:dTDP-4-amino-4,6-dideoxy-D-galactose acyltransferase